MIRTTRACAYWTLSPPLRPATKNTSISPFLTSPTPEIRRRQTTSKASPQDTQHPTSQTAPQTTKTIPGPGWLWLEPIYEPFRAYGRAQRRRPYLTQFLSSLTVYFVGDLVAQSISSNAPAEVETTEVEGGAVEEEEESKGWVVDWVEGRDWMRTGRALLIGGMSAVPGYKWFLWLSNSFNYNSKILSLTTKVTVNQLTFTPIFNSYFFGMQYLLTTPISSLSFHDLLERLQHTVPTSWINSCKLWPAVTAFSFSFIPIEYRSIFGGVIAIGWQTYLSILNQRAQREEEVEHSHEHGRERLGEGFVKGSGAGVKGIREHSRRRFERKEEEEECAA